MGIDPKDPKVRQGIRDETARTRSVLAQLELKRNEEIDKTKRTILGIFETAEFKAGQEGEKEGAKQPVSTSFPKDEKISQGNAGSTLAGNIGQSQTGLDEILNAQTTTTPIGGGGSGLPARQQESTTTSDKTLLRGVIADLIRTKNPKFGTTPQTSTRRSDNLQYEQAIQDRALSAANLQHSVSRGLTPASNLAPGINQLFGALPPADRARAEAIAGRELQNLKVQEAEITRNKAIAAVRAQVGNGLKPDVAMAWQGASANSVEEMTAYSEALEKKFKNSPARQREEHIASMKEQQMENDLAVSQWKFDAANPASPANIAAVERAGIFNFEGLTTGLTEKQVKDGEEKVLFSADDAGNLELDISEASVGAAHEYVGARLARWQPMNMPIPDVKGFGRDFPDGHWMGKQENIHRLDPQDVYEWTAAADQSGFGFTKDGRVTFDLSQVDTEMSDKIRENAVEKLNLNGYRALIDDTGTAQIVPDPTHPYPEWLGKNLNVSRGTLAAGIRRKKFIESPRDTIGVEGGDPLPPRQGTGNPPPEFFQGVNAELARQAQEARTISVGEAIQRRDLRRTGPIPQRNN